MAETEAPARFAYVCDGGQIHVMQLETSGRMTSRQLTWSTEPTTLGGWGGVGGGSTASWPCWSPDGSRIACFIDHPNGEPETHVAVMEVAGVHEHRFPALEGRMPIHVQWSPDGQRLGVLVQFEDQLELWIAEVLPTPRALRVVAEGSPLFFSWACGGTHVLLHVGDEAEGPARLELRDVVGDADDVVFRVPPSNFCVPFSVRSEGEERVLYVIRRDHESQVVSTRLDGEDVLGLAVLPGLVALIPSRDGHWLAATSAPDADGSPYDGIQILTCDGLTLPQALVDGPVLAFFWTSSSQAPMWVQWDAGRQYVRLFMTADETQRQELARFRPTRDQYFQFHFFEQFAHSHPLVSANGRWVVWSGHGPESDGLAPGVFLKDLQAVDAGPKRVCSGSYAVFSPC